MISSGAPAGAIPATRSANCGLSIHTLRLPGTCPSPKSAESRRSSTPAPCARASFASRAEYGRGLAETSGASPRFLATIFSNAAGLGGMPAMMKSTNARLSS